MQSQALLYDMILGYQKSQILLAVSRLKIADELKDGPKSAAQITQQLGTKGDYLTRILRAAAAVGILNRDPQTLDYSLNHLSKLLIDGPSSLSHLVNLVCGPEHASPWFELDKTARDGSVAFETTYNEKLFEYYGKHPESSELFNKGLTANGSLWSLGDMLSKYYNFENCGCIVDIGGGEGSIVKRLLRTHPKLKGIVFDLEHVVADAKANLKLDGDITDRLSFISGSFFESAPEGGDYYMLSSVIHDWPDDKAIDILRVTNKAMPANGKVLVVDRVLKEVDGDVSVNLFDIYMMVLVDGKERTEKEFEYIFNGAGLKLEQIIPLHPTPFCIIVGSKQ